MVGMGEQRETQAGRRRSVQTRQQRAARRQTQRDARKTGARARGDRNPRAAPCGHFARDSNAASCCAWCQECIEEAGADTGRKVLVAVEASADRQVFRAFEAALAHTHASLTA